MGFLPKEAGGREITEYRASPDGSTFNWWLRSPYYDNDYEFCNVNNNGNTNYNNAEYSYGVAPGFEKLMGQNK